MIKKKNTSCLCFKQNSNREAQVILLIISNGGKEWNYLPVRKTISIIKRIKF